MKYGFCMQIRPIDLPDDQVEVLRFVEKWSFSRGVQLLSENKLGLIARDDDRPGIGLVAESRGAIVGYAALAPARESGEWAVEVVIDPNGSAIGPLVAAAVQAAADAGGVHVRWWTYDSRTQAFPPRFDFEPERQLLRMTRPLPAGQEPRFPPGVSATGFEAGNETAWLMVNNAAFAHHHENGAMSRAELDRRMSSEWFDPEGMRLAWEGDQLVGSCWTKIHPSGEGEIYIIGAHPDQQGKGLGTALVLEGMRHLAERECPSVFLYTDADNEPAVALYRRLGFTVDRAHQAFVKALGD